MPALVETMFSAREVPWHGLGVVTEGVLTAKDALTTAGLDWTVSSRPVYYATADKRSKTKIPGQYAIVRDMDERYLGRVGSKYVPIQNAEAFAFADNLVDNGAAKYETAGSLRGGKQVFLSMRVGGELLIGGEDRHDLYLMLRTSHDGSTSLGAYLTAIRPVCTNTVTLGIAASEQRWEMRHRSTLDGKIEEAREALKMTFAYAKDFVALGDQLIATKLTDEEARRLIESAFPKRPKTEEALDNVMALYHDSPTVRYTGTAWGLLNAVTEYYDHGRDTRSLEARFTGIIDGEGAKLRDKVASLALA